MKHADSPTPRVPFLTLAEVAEMIGGRAEGDPSIPVRGVAPLDQAGPEELGFLALRRYLKYLPACQAGAVLVSEALATEARSFPGRVVVKEPHGILPALLGCFYPPPPREPGVHPTAVLGKGVKLGREAVIGPYAVLEAGVVVGDRVDIGAHCVLGRGASVGDDSVLHPHVVLYPGTKVGARAILHSGVRLGVDGFGFVPGPGEPRKVPQVGTCVVEDGVEIGGNCCIDRGSIGRTVVGQGSKLDNLVHLAHNVQIGKGVLIAAMVGVAGSTRIGDGTMFGGQAGVGGHLEVGERVQVGAQAGVIRDVPPGEILMGFPARNHREYFKAMGALYRLPETLRRLGEMDARLKRLEGKPGT